MLAVLASRAVDGACVSLVNSREQDMATSPAIWGMRAELKLGARRTGEITAARMVFHLNSGAYADISPKARQGGGGGLLGPYRFPNIDCDSFGVYTNAPYATSYRGFGHAELFFCLERMMDKLADALGMDLRAAGGERAEGGGTDRHPGEGHPEQHGGPCLLP